MDGGSPLDSGTLPDGGCCTFFFQNDFDNNPGASGPIGTGNSGGSGPRGTDTAFSFVNVGTLGNANDAVYVTTGAAPAIVMVPFAFPDAGSGGPPDSGTVGPPDAGSCCTPPPPSNAQSGTTLGRFSTMDGTSAADVGWTLTTPSSSMCARAYVYLDMMLSPGESATLIRLNKAGPNNYLDDVHGGAPVSFGLHATDETTAVTSLVPAAVPFMQWFRVEACATTGSPSTLTVQLFSTANPLGTGTTIDVTGNSWDTVAFGIAAGGTTAEPIYLDDIAISNIGPIGSTGHGP
jgi:hypothetical protein